MLKLISRPILQVHKILPKHYTRLKQYPSKLNLIHRTISIRLYSKHISAMSPPPGILHDFSYKLTPQELLSKTDDLINQVKKLCDQVANVSDSDVSFETVLKVLDEAECLLGTDQYYLDTSQNFVPDKGLRDASTEADRKLREFRDEINMRKDVFDKLLVLKNKGEPLKPLAQRYLEKLILLGKRNGLHLDESTQQKVKEMKSKINNLNVDFTKNVNDVTTTLEFSEQELDGMPSDFISSLKKSDTTGKYEVTLKYPHVFPIWRKCRVPETRKRLDFAFNTQCIDENSEILIKVRKLRHELAVLLGYPSHAAYITEVQMSKSADTVNKFLTELAEKMAPLWVEEKKYLLELKKKECAELGIPFDGKLNSWDTSYYNTIAAEIKYSIDKTKLKKYFPLPVVKESLLNIYQDLLGLKFKKVQVDVWHEDVEPYSVEDASSGTLLGYFYLDLFPRPNKYGHACIAELQNGFIKPDGQRQVSVCVMLANFTKPVADKPSLLDHDEVTTFFHEFGHVMHHICAETEFAFLNFKNLEKDFIETPSQMLENWCWEKEPLKKLSSHYQDNSDIPDDMLNALISSRFANIGYSTLRQVILALFDQKFHSSPEGDISDLYNGLSKKYLGIECQAGTLFPCHFHHLAHEYDALYYGYLWSEVYSMDMFETRFGSKNIFNPEVGMDYRNKILRPGVAKDAIDLVCDFLGRKPTQDAFLRSKGLKV